MTTLKEAMNFRKSARNTGSCEECVYCEVEKDATWHCIRALDGSIGGEVANRRENPYRWVCDYYLEKR